MARKRPASALEDEADGEKSDNIISTLARYGLHGQSSQEQNKAPRIAQSEHGGTDSTSLPVGKSTKRRKTQDERIYEMLRSSDYMLWLQRRKTLNCSAEDCVAFDVEQEWTYGFRMTALISPNLKEKLYFHTRCMENMVPDRIPLMSLADARQIHPASRHWRTNRGKAFDVEAYEKYERRVKEYEQQSGAKPPERSDFFKGEPRECKLHDLIREIYRPKGKAMKEQTEESTQTSPDEPSNSKKGSAAMPIEVSGDTPDEEDDEVAGE